jgi:hypothetical protein
MSDISPKLFTDAAQKKRTAVVMRLASAVWEDMGMVQGVHLANTFLAGLIVSTLYDDDVDEARVAQRALDHCGIDGDREKIATKLVAAWKARAA